MQPLHLHLVRTPLRHWAEAALPAVCACGGTDTTRGKREVRAAAVAGGEIGWVAVWSNIYRQAHNAAAASIPVLKATLLLDLSLTGTLHLQQGPRLSRIWGRAGCGRTHSAHHQNGQEGDAGAAVCHDCWLGRRRPAGGDSGCTCMCRWRLCMKLAAQ